MSILAEKNQNIILFKDTHVFGERRVIYLFNKYDKLVLIFELDLTPKDARTSVKVGLIL